jgi:hypothetical protein
MLVNALEGLRDLLLVFFALQNFLPRRSLRHLAEFEHVINEYPAQYQNRNVHGGSIELTQQSALFSLLVLPRPRPSTPYSQLRGVPQFQSQVLPVCPCCR